MTPSGTVARAEPGCLPDVLADRVVRITIRWPSGVVQMLENVAVDQILSVVEGA